MARTVSFSAGQPMTLGNALSQRSPLYAYGQQTLADASQATPLEGGWMEGVSRLGRALAGGMFMNQGREQDQNQESKRQLRLSDALTPFVNGTATPEQISAAMSVPEARPFVMQYVEAQRQRNAPPTGMRRNAQGALEADPDYLTAHAAVTAAGRDPLAGISLIPGSEHHPPLVFDRGEYAAGRGGAGAPAPGGAGPQAGPGLVPPPADLPPVLQQLWRGESGNNPQAVSPQGAQGPLQFDPRTFAGVLQRHPELVQAGITPQHIMVPAAAAAVGRAHMQDILRDGQDLIGRQVGNATITPDALVRAAWLGGVAGARRHIESNGQHDPADAFGTRVSQYAQGTARNLPAIGQGQDVTRAPLAPMGTQVAQAGPATATDAMPSAAPAPQVAQAPQYPPGVRPLVPPSGMPSNRNFTQEMDLNQRYVTDPIVRAASRTIPILQSMYESAPQNNRIADLDLVYGIATIVDPDSVVRETDAVAVRRSQGLDSQVIGWINMVNGGQSLQPEVRSQILQLARQRVGGMVDQANHRHETMTGMGRRYGLNVDTALGPRLSLPDRRTTPAPGAVAPPAGPSVGSQVGRALGEGVRSLTGQPPAAAAPGVPPATGGQPGESQPTGQRQRARNPATGEEVEWDGSAWQLVR